MMNTHKKEEPDDNYCKIMMQVTPTKKSNKDQKQYIPDICMNCKCEECHN